MSEFIKSLLKHSFFLSMLIYGQIDKDELLKVENTTFYSQDAFTIEKFILLDSIEFEQVTITKINGGYSLIFLSENPEIYTNANRYFDSANNDREALDSVYRRNGCSRRKFSDNAMDYKIYITVRKFGKKYLANLILEPS